MKNNSKINTVLLVILILLVGFGLWTMSQKKEIEEIVVPSPSKDTQIPPVESPKKDIEIPKKVPVISIKTSSTITTITEGKEFTIKLGEKVIVADSYGATFKLTDFYYHPCPDGAQCIWSGLDVFYEIQLPLVKNTDGTVQQQEKLYVKSQPLQDTTKMPFIITVKDSDYKTYAKIILQMQAWGN